VPCLGCATLVAVVKSANLRYGNDGPDFQRVHGPRFRCVLGQREMRPGFVIQLVNTKPIMRNRARSGIHGTRGLVGPYGSIEYSSEVPGPWHTADWIGFSVRNHQKYLSVAKSPSSRKIRDLALKS
jgi:hypothetical protein